MAGWWSFSLRVRHKRKNLRNRTASIATGASTYRCFEEVRIEPIYPGIAVTEKLSRVFNDVSHFETLE